LPNELHEKLGMAHQSAMETNRWEAIQPEKLLIEPKKFVDFQTNNTKIWKKMTITSHKKDKIMLNINIFNIHLNDFQSVVPFGKLKPIQPPPKKNDKDGQKSHGFNCTRWCPPVMFVGLDSPHEYYSYLRTINHSDIGVMFTNWTLSWGHHLVDVQTQPIYVATAVAPCRSAPACGPCVLAPGPAPSPQPGGGKRYP